MYQMPRIDRTALSRNAGPVCMTRAAIRPAKSFWKKVHPCRTTCQWLCQRTMLVRPGISIWLTMMACAKCAAGRTTRSSTAIATSWSPARSQIVSGSWAETSETIRPMQTGFAERVERRLDRVEKAVQIAMIGFDKQQSGDDLAGGMALLQIGQGRDAVVRVVIVRELAEPHGRAVVLHDRFDRAR